LSSKPNLCKTKTPPSSGGLTIFVGRGLAPAVKLWIDLDGWVLCATLLCLPFRTATAFQGCSRLWQTAKPIAVLRLRRRTFFAFGKKEFSSK